MKFHNIGYLFKEGIKNLWKNRTMSIASIGVLISCLLLTGCAALVSVNLTSMMASVEGNNSITIYLTEGLPALTAIEIGDQIRSIENVSDCTFIPKDDATAFSPSLFKYLPIEILPPRSPNSAPITTYAAMI